MGTKPRRGKKSETKENLEFFPTARERERERERLRERERTKAVDAPFVKELWLGDQKTRTVQVACAPRGGREVGSRALHTLRLENACAPGDESSLRRKGLSFLKIWPLRALRVVQGGDCVDFWLLSLGTYEQCSREPAVDTFDFRARWNSRKKCESKVLETRAWPGRFLQTRYPQRQAAICIS